MCAVQVPDVHAYDARRCCRPGYALGGHIGAAARDSRQADPLCAVSPLAARRLRACVRAHTVDCVVRVDGGCHRARDDGAHVMRLARLVASRLAAGRYARSGSDASTS